MDKKTDQRIIKTQEKLTLALAELAETQSLDAISVFDLCQKASVRRATFYKHFRDKQDFLSFIISDRLKKIKDKVCERVDRGDTVLYLTSFVGELTDYFDRYSKIYDNILRSNSFPAILAMVVRHTNEMILEDITLDKGRDYEPTALDTVTADFINGGLTTVIVARLAGDDMEKSEMLEGIKAILTGIIDAKKRKNI